MADANVKMALLCVTGRGVRHVSRKTKVFETLPVTLLKVALVFCEIERKVKFVFCVEFAFADRSVVYIPFLILVVPAARAFALDANVTAQDGLSENIIGADGEIGVLPGKVEGMIRAHINGERRQFVARNVNTLAQLQIAAVAVGRR